MKWLGAIERLIVLIFVAIFAFQGRGQAEPKVAGDRGQAVRALQRYLHLRLQDADWKEYSKFITWPDEPSWDCKWVESDHKVGAPVRKKQKVVISVVYTRLGLFCDDFDFKPEPKVVTINYELVSRPTGWKVSSPIPDYPDIDGDVLVKSLNATAGNASETPERRAEAETTARKITEALHNLKTETGRKLSQKTAGCR
jgi:hypothetical protein